MRDDVVFPEALTEVAVGRSASIAAIAEAEATDGWLAVFAQRMPDADAPRPEDLYSVGCATRVLSIEPMEGAPGVSVRLQPVTRIRAVSWTDGDKPRVRARALPESNAPLDALTRQALEALCVATIRHCHGWSRDEAERYVRSIATSARLAWLSAAYLALDVEVLQSLLECDDVHANAQRVLTCRDELGLGDPPRSWWRRLLDALFG